MGNYLYELSGKRYTPSFLQGHPPSQSSGTLMSLRAIPLSLRLGVLYPSFAPTGAPALAELGHPDVASGRYSWAVRARMVVLKPSCREPSGRRLDLPYGVTAMPSTQRSFLASCLRYLTPVFPPRFRVHSSQAEQPAVHSRPHNPHPTSHHREGRRERAWGEAGMFRRDIRVSEAERGRVPCRSKEHTASTRSTLTQNKKPPTVG